MRPTVRSQLAALTLVALLAACGGGQRPPPPSAPRPPAYSGQRPAAPSVSTEAYFATAASIDLFEIKSAELAMQRAQRPRTREFAGMMQGGHQGLAGQLSLAGRRLNLLPSAILQPRHTAMLAELEASPDFDSTYRLQQVRIHDEALALHRNYAARGASPTLRPVAQSAVAVIERHIRTLRYL